MKEEFFNRVEKSVLPAGPYCFSGDEAVAEGALAARCGYFAGYPITPATEIMERISNRFPQNGAVFMQMEDEISSIGSAIGAVWAGAKAGDTIREIRYQGEPRPAGDGYQRCSVRD